MENPYSLIILVTIAWLNVRRKEGIRTPSCMFTYRASWENRDKGMGFQYYTKTYASYLNFTPLRVTASVKSLTLSNSTNRAHVLPVVSGFQKIFLVFSIFRHFSCF